MKPYLLCPCCGSDDVMNNGTTRRGKQNYNCRDCGRQFVEPPQWKTIGPDSKAIIDRLLLERVPLAGIARVLQVGEAWLQRYVNRRLSAVPRCAKFNQATGDLFYDQDGATAGLGFAGLGGLFAKLPGVSSLSTVDFEIVA